MNPEKQLEKLKQVFEILEDGKASTEEVAEAFAMVLKVIGELKDHLLKKVDNGLEDMAIENSNLAKEMEKMEERMKKMHSEMMKSHGKEMASMKKEVMSAIEEVKEMIPQMPDISNLERRVGDVEKREMPKIPENLVNQEGLLAEVEALKEELRKEIDEVRRLPRGRMGMRKIPIVKRHNLTSLTDGSTRAFTLPRDTIDVLGVWGTDFPQNYNPLTDWTLSGQTLTLSSGFPAPASGSTLFAIIETLFYS